MPKSGPDQARQKVQSKGKKKEKEVPKDLAPWEEALAEKPKGKGKKKGAGQENGASVAKGAVGAGSESGAASATGSAGASGGLGGGGASAIGALLRGTVAEQGFHELAVRDLCPAQPAFLLAVDNFFSARECESLIRAAEAASLQPASASDLRPRKGEAFLDRSSLAFVDPGLSSSVWGRLRPLLPDIGERTPVGLHGDGVGGRAGMLKFYR
jgi:hypothetical protein